MKKSELNKLKAMQKKCDKYADKVWEMVEAAYELVYGIYDKQIAEEFHKYTEEARKLMLKYNL